MAKLKGSVFSDQHLLCLMEIWFDRSVPIILGLAEATRDQYGLEYDYCPFCDTSQKPTATAINHEKDCAVILAHNLYYG